MKKITAKSDIAKKTLAKWLAEHDPETLEELKGWAETFGEPIREVGYRNLDDAMQADLISSLRESQKVSARKSISDAKACL